MYITGVFLFMKKNMTENAEKQNLSRGNNNKAKKIFPEEKSKENKHFPCNRPKRETCITLRSKMETKLSTIVVNTNNRKATILR